MPKPKPWEACLPQEQERRRYEQEHCAYTVSVGHTPIPWIARRTGSGIKHAVVSTFDFGDEMAGWCQKQRLTLHHYWYDWGNERFIFHFRKLKHAILFRLFWGGDWRQES